MTKLITVTIGGAGTGGSANYDRLNFSRNGTASIYIGSLNIGSPDPVGGTTVNEAQDPNRVGDAAARLAAHEIGHLLGLVAINGEWSSASLWADVASCHGLSGTGLGGSTSHHVSTGDIKTFIMNYRTSRQWPETWNSALYVFAPTLKSYMTKVLQ